LLNILQSKLKRIKRKGLVLDKKIVEIENGAILEEYKFKYGLKISMIRKENTMTRFSVENGETQIDQQNNKIIISYKYFSD